MIKELNYADLKGILEHLDSQWVGVKNFVFAVEMSRLRKRLVEEIKIIEEQLQLLIDDSSKLIEYQRKKIEIDLGVLDKRKIPKSVIKEADANSILVLEMLLSEEDFKALLEENMKEAAD